MKAAIFLFIFRGLAVKCHEYFDYDGYRDNGGDNVMADGRYFSIKVRCMFSTRINELTVCLVVASKVGIP